MSDLVKIEGRLRETHGKGPARRLRATGWIPGIIQSKSGNTCIELDPKWLSKAWQSESREFNLDLSGDVKKVRIHELQINAVKRSALHVDLMFV
ncbi:MAG: hypothetical protein AB8C84_03880 [Oligoflexales bacterium]